MGESAKIVAVDDERVILDNIESLLQSSGFQVVKVTTATTVLDTVRNEKPNLVLLDIRMPDGDGLVALFQRLIEKRRLRLYPYTGPQITFNTQQELDRAECELVAFFTHQDGESK